MKKLRKCKDCGKGITEKNKSGMCSRCYHNDHGKKRYAKLKLEHKCCDCGKEIKPIIYYPSFCDKCKRWHSNGKK